jgi:hypothetical protein
MFPAAFPTAWGSQAGPTARVRHGKPSIPGCLLHPDFIREKAGAQSHGQNGQQGVPRTQPRVGTGDLGIQRVGDHPC